MKFQASHVPRDPRPAPSVGRDELRVIIIVLMINITIIISVMININLMIIIMINIFVGGNG